MALNGGQASECTEHSGGKNRQAGQDPCGENRKDGGGVGQKMPARVGWLATCPTGQPSRTKPKIPRCLGTARVLAVHGQFQQNLSSCLLPALPLCTLNADSPSYSSHAGWLPFVPSPVCRSFRASGGGSDSRSSAPDKHPLWQ